MTMDIAGHDRVVNLVGVTDGFEEIRNLQVVSGRYFDPDDLASESKVCLLTEALARRITPVGDPVGSDVQVGELHFTVIGVFRERVATLGDSELTQRIRADSFFAHQVLHGERLLPNALCQCR